MYRHVHHFIMLTIIFVTITVGSAGAQWGQAVLDSVLVGPTNDNLGRNSLALDNQGKLHLVYDQVVGTDHNLFYKSKPQGETWSQPVQIGDHTLIQSSQFYVAVNKATGTPYVVFIEGGQLKLGVEGALWNFHTLTLPGDVTLVGTPAVTADPSNYAHVAVIVQVSGQYKMGYGYWDGMFHYQTIANSELGPYGSGASPSITAISTGGAAISYRAGDYGAYRTDVAENHQLGGTTWDIQTILPPGYNTFGSSVKAIANDNLYLACDGNQGWGFPGHTFFCTKPAGQPTWSNPLDVTGSYGGSNCQLAMQNNGTPHVVWERTSGNIYTGEIIYATNVQGYWASQILQSGDKYQPSLEVDASGNGSLVFEQYVGSQNNDVYYYGYVAPVMQPPQNIEIILAAGAIVIPPQGGSFNYGVSIANTGSTPQTFHAWIMVYLPNSNPYGPVLGPMQFTFPGNLIISRSRTQYVPGSAPPGIYIYRGYVGVYPTVITDSSGFNFIKQGSGNLDLGAGEWTCSGDELIPTIQPSAFSLTKVSPNPFNPSTTISYELRAASYVKLSIFDVSGRQVGTLANDWQNAGSHQVTFDGSSLAGGVYLYRLEVNGQAVTGKMVLVK